MLGFLRWELLLLNKPKASKGFIAAASWASGKKAEVLPSVR
jgi:hypothetical protein